MIGSTIVIPILQTMILIPQGKSITQGHTVNKEIKVESTVIDI